MPVVGRRQSSSRVVPVTTIDSWMADGDSVTVTGESRTTWRTVVNPSALHFDRDGQRDVGQRKAARRVPAVAVVGAAVLNGDHDRGGNRLVIGGLHRAGRGRSGTSAANRISRAAVSRDRPLSVPAFELLHERDQVHDALLGERVVD